MNEIAGMLSSIQKEKKNSNWDSVSGLKVLGNLTALHDLVIPTSGSIKEFYDYVSLERASYSPDSLTTRNQNLEKNTVNFGNVKQIYCGKQTNRDSKDLEKKLVKRGTELSPISEAPMNYGGKFADKILSTFC
ncbi:hypothetical protein HMI54_004330 [Coelomomyces lativittatus]|nr:hypothetical protein HMI56_006160 [Coelomomyces lativittatus]KAJ1517027.1 hypothetical protein HMI55_000808 [Coelomomyces lativittatus]KAJ1517744.1 hypothetical protein HMI54_004330 [Coelomomyces lativittatus]